MQKNSILYFVTLIMITILGAFALAMGVNGQESAEKAETEKPAIDCLACHGSFDDLIQATADFTAASGGTTSPHRYIPHDDKEGIPKCTECHTPHEIPLEDVSTVVKPDNVDWCYQSCHHAQNLQPCSTCH